MAANGAPIHASSVLTAVVSWRSNIVVFQIVLYGAGGRVGFFQGDIKLLPDDMKHLQPTIFPVVPRLLNRVYDKVSSSLNGQFMVRGGGGSLRSAVGKERCQHSQL